MKVIWQISFLSYNIPYEKIKYSGILHRTLVVKQKVYDKANTKNDWKMTVGFAAFSKAKEKPC